MILLDELDSYYYLQTSTEFHVSTDTIVTTVNDLRKSSRIITHDMDQKDWDIKYMDTESEAVCVKCVKADDNQAIRVFVMKHDETLMASNLDINKKVKVETKEHRFIGVLINFRFWVLVIFIGIFVLIGIYGLVNSGILAGFLGGASTVGTAASTVTSVTSATVGTVDTISTRKLQILWKL